MGVKFTVLGYMDSVGFGFLACREMIPDLRELADGATEESDVLKRRVKARSGRTRAARR